MLGLVFLIALTVAIDDIPRISASDSPVAVILRDQLGRSTESILLVAIVFAFFGAGMVTLATCSRIVYAMARDSRFPAHRLMRRVNPRTQTPIPATILIVVLGVVLMVALPGDALLELITAGTIHRAGPLRRDHRPLPGGAQDVWTARRARSTSAASRCRSRSAP